MNSASLLQVIRKRRSVRVYKAGKVSDKQLAAILEAARWAPSGANTQPWEFVVTRDKEKMKRCREIFYNEWQQRKREDPVNYKGLSKYYVGDASVLVLVCADPPGSGISRVRGPQNIIRNPEFLERVIESPVRACRSVWTKQGI